MEQSVAIKTLAEWARAGRVVFTVVDILHPALAVGRMSRWSTPRAENVDHHTIGSGNRRRFPRQRSRANAHERGIARLAQDTLPWL